MQKKKSPKKTAPGRSSSGNKRLLIEKAERIKLLILDVDGVLTDGSIILDNAGNEYKRFHVRDGHGIKLLQRYGVEVVIITGRRSKVVDLRAKELGIKHIYQRCLDKVVAYEDIKSRLSLRDDEIAYMGDDVVDIPLMKRVGLAVAVSDAQQDIIAFADIVTDEEGGKCAVRSITEFILKAKGLWREIIDGYAKA
ncbi:3-deoxy-D-manno-octulosonate 8-phosphate phosphatase KdsC [bacterium BMS3Abin07]|nr:3-deoxy-D-manno-octulosonate 8-phosphate phosphatase KdsC [bacterium BMS3Abin07]GBE32398.1 3-deoxy-D-manno-octulosonate 8-phosphate phosphatase KdsC [bacterium BMS3Bbin05]HDO21830.1 HAD-IIIA family hydrolase [Nitrospirota bacterium]HDZ88703.1 HAD-IIIA family hydrolase [Nitrospirota bacterium]